MSLFTKPVLVFNPLPHGVLATFYPTARGLMGPPKKDDISREKTILMTSLRTHRASAVSSPGFHYTHPPPPPCAIERSLCTAQAPHHSLADNFFKEGNSLYRNHVVLLLLCRHKLFYLYQHPQNRTVFWSQLRGWKRGGGGGYCILCSIKQGNLPKCSKKLSTVWSINSYTF